MLVNDFNPMLIEGPHDLHIFKAIYIAGAPGSGKNTIIQKLGLDTIGLKLVDVDETLERIGRMDTISRGNYSYGGDLTLRRQSMWARNYLGLAISTTGRLAEKTIEVDRSLRSVGYETMMVFVDVSKETAARRINQRPIGASRAADIGRAVDAEYFNVAYEQVKYNMPLYQRLFSDDFILVTNEDIVTENETLDETLRDAKKKIRSFLARPLNKKAQAVVNAHHPGRSRQLAV